MTLVQRPDLIYSLFATTDTVPAGQGNVYTTRLYHDKAPADVPLPGCCELPPPCKTTSTDTQFSVNEYGCWEPICVLKEIHSRNRDLNMRAILNGRQMRDTEDALTLKIMNSALCVVNETRGENGDRPTEPTVAGIQTIEGILDDRNAITAFESIVASNRIGTCPVPDAYIGAVPNEIFRDFASLPGFVPKSGYAEQMCLRRAERGYISRTRFFSSKRGIIEKGASANGRDVYTVFIGGFGAISIVDLEGYPPEMGYTPPSDPMNRCASTYWKMLWGGVINPEQHICKYRVTKKAA